MRRQPRRRAVRHETVMTRSLARSRSSGASIALGPYESRYLSVSHSGTLVACALRLRKGIGVDVAGRHSSREKPVSAMLPGRAAASCWDRSRVFQNLQGFADLQSVAAQRGQRVGESGWLQRRVRSIAPPHQSGERLHLILVRTPMPLGADHGRSDRRFSRSLVDKVLTFLQ